MIAIGTAALLFVANGAPVALAQPTPASPKAGPSPSASPVAPAPTASPAPSPPAAPPPSPTLAPALAPSPAAPEQPPTAEQISRAKTLFDLGAKAYDSDQFPAAIQAFLEAYRLSRRPGPIFSAAQAYRRMFGNDRTNTRALREAVRLYKDYLDKQKAGGRVSEAQTALLELEPTLKQIVESGTEPAPVAATALDTSQKTRLMVSSPIKAAMASVDGGEPAEMPLIQELTPGKHTLRIMAEGFVDDEREIAAVDGQVYGLDIALRERPAFLTIRANDGSQVLVDGRPEGTTPLQRPLELAPGSHVVTVSKTGHQPYSAEIELHRDQKRSIDVALEQTTQRYASFVTLGAAGVLAIGGAVVTGLAYKEQDVALEIERLKKDSNISQSQRATHETAIANRNDLRVAAVAAFGGAFAVGVLAAGLFVFDRPTPGLPSRLRDDTPKPPEAKRGPKVEVSAVPLVGPDGGGALINVRF